MKAKVIVLPKRDFNYKLKLVSNDDWWKTFEFFWALALEKTQIRHKLPVPSSFSDPMKFASLCWWSLLNLFSFSRCSSLDIRLFYLSFLVLLRVPLAVFCLFWCPLELSSTFFSTHFTSFTSFFFWSLCLFLFILFSLRTLSLRTWIIKISSRWQSFSCAGIVALRVD